MNIQTVQTQPIAGQHEPIAGIATQEAGSVIGHELLAGAADPSLVPCRVAGNQRERRHVPNDDRPSGDERPLTDRHTRQNH